MKRLFFAGFVLTTVAFLKAQDIKGPYRISIVKGNELYAWCSAAQKSVQPDANGNIKVTGSRDDIIAGMSCWAYIEGVVDSTPAGGEFSPSETVRTSQYVDVVTEYLKTHANIRDRAAAFLVQNALREAFPRRP